MPVQKVTAKTTVPIVMVTHGLSSQKLMSLLNVIAPKYIVKQVPKIKWTQRRMVFQFLAMPIPRYFLLYILSIFPQIHHWISHAILCTFQLTIYRIHIYS